MAASRPPRSTPICPPDMILATVVIVPPISVDTESQLDTAESQGPDALIPAEVVGDQNRETAQAARLRPLRLSKRRDDFLQEFRPCRRQSIGIGEVNADRPPMADMCKSRPEWVPASEVHGEGIFIRFNEAAVRQWESVYEVGERDKALRQGHTGWRNARNLNPRIGYPGVRYAMIHTFAHVLIREFALECGYNAASIRERVYASAEGNPIAGVLLYTAGQSHRGAR